MTHHLKVIIWVYTYTLKLNDSLVNTPHPTTTNSTTDHNQDNPRMKQESINTPHTQNDNPDIVAHAYAISTMNSTN